MDLIKIKKTFNSAWQIEEKKEIFEQFKIRILNDFIHIDMSISWEGQRKFCKFYAIENKYRVSQYGEHYSTNIIDRLKQENNESAFFELITVILNLPFNPAIPQHNQLYFNAVAETIEFSQLPIYLKVTNQGVYIFPVGEKLLDVELVTNALTFLNGKSNEHFISALTNLYDKKFISSAESIRRTLEEFLRQKLKNHAGLQSNITKLGQQLKACKVEDNIRNFISESLIKLNAFFNDNSKHNDGNFSTNETFFLIYLAALVMSYLSKVNFDSQDQKN